MATTPQDQIASHGGNAPKFPSNIVVMGTENIGKSTICSTIAGKAGLFKSGLQAGTDVVWKQLGNGGLVIDTPGIEADNAARTIKEALKLPWNGQNSEARTVVLFAVPLTAIRVYEEHYVIPNKVLRAIATNTPKNFHFVINQISKKIQGMLIRENVDQKPTEAGLAFVKMLDFFHHPPQSIILIPMDDEILCEEDQILSHEMIVCDRNLVVRSRGRNLSKICDSLQPITYRVDDVKDFRFLMTDFSHSCIEGIEERMKDQSQTAAELKMREGNLESSDDERRRNQKETVETQSQPKTNTCYEFLCNALRNCMLM